MNHLPYIGVTGITTLHQARAAVRCAREPINRKIQVGVLVSSKTLAGQTNRWPQRYPKIENIKDIFPNHPAALNFIHYNTDDPGTLYDQLMRLVEIGDELLHGFQLNMKWPTVGIYKFRMETENAIRIVLQVGNRAMAEVGNSPQEFADRVALYDSLVDDILIDPSGGTGKPFVPSIMRDFLTELRSRNLAIHAGIAGGFGPDTLYLLEPLLPEFSSISIDAEKRVRDPETDRLDILRMTTYLNRAQNMFASCQL